MPRRGISIAALFLAAGLLAAAEPPVLRVPGAPDRPIAPASLLGRDSRDVRLEDTDGNVKVYHGVALLDVLEKGGLDLRTMAGQRKAAGEVVLAAARDGYTVVFSVGELWTNRSNPKVFLVAETSAGPLPENEGPVRLIVYGDVARSAYALARIELKVLAENTRAGKEIATRTNSSSRREKSPDRREGGGSRRGSRSAARGQASGRARTRASRSPVRPKGAGPSQAEATGFDPPPPFL